ncbi:MAG TPA: serine/threonine-protein kinase [Myxococcota bacterium]|nr:serine/threonine-protein kinase [Myxococcota bacterium]
MDNDPLIGAVIEDRYELVAAIGQGGAARVYRAIQQPLGREVALKVVRPDLQGAQRKEFQSRFLREAAGAGRLAHPAIVRVYDFGQTADGDCFIVMELLVGRPLRRLVNSPVDPREVARIGAVLGRGLRHAHVRGVVHRDVKPGNILLVRDDDGVEQPKLLDFGLVKAEDEPTFTGVGTFMGTPHYIAPEQAKSDGVVDGRADQYSLGVILYRMLTGVLPYMAEHPMGIALAHMKEPYPPMRVRAPEVTVDPELEDIVRRCLEKAPGDRFPDGRELARALEAWLGAGPVLREDSTVSTIELPEPEPERTWVPLVAGVIGLLLALGAGVALWPEATEEFPLPVPDPRFEVPELTALPETPVSTAPRSVFSPPPVDEEPVLGEVPVEVAIEVPVEEPLEPPAPAAVEPLAPAEEPPPVGPSASYDGVQMTREQAARTLAWVNEADEQALRAGGVYGRGANIILEARPFATIEAFVATPYIGEKTVRAAYDAAN